MIGHTITELEVLKKGRFWYCGVFPHHPPHRERCSDVEMCRETDTTTGTGGLHGCWVLCARLWCGLCCLLRGCSSGCSVAVSLCRDEGVLTLLGDTVTRNGRSDGPNGQEQCGVGGRLLGSGCLGSWLVKMPVVRRSCRRVSSSWVAGCPERLQASESILGSMLSGEAWRSGQAAGE